MYVSKEEFKKLLSVLADFGGEWIVSSNPEGCPEGYTKVFIRRKRVKKPWEILRVHLVVSECLADEDAETLKQEIRAQLSVTS